MSKQKRWRGKLGGNHSTVIQTAWRFLPDVIADPSVTKVSPGFITGKSTARIPSVKIIDERGFILLSVRAGGGHQEVRVFSMDVERAKEVIAAAAKRAHFRVTYGSRIEPAP